MKKRVIFFDMDGTIILNTNSVKILCDINGKAEEVNQIEKREENNEIDWILADYEKATLMKGVVVSKVENEIINTLEIIENLEFVVNFLQNIGIKVVLVTAGPIQVANLIGKKYGFDKIYGSRYEEEGGMMTGNIISHLGSSGKAECVKEFCQINKTKYENCIAIGDSSSDIGMFAIVGKSVAINYSKSLIGKANIYLKTKDLKEVLKYLND